MFALFANIFGYLLKFLYNLVNNYGLAIILFTVAIKLLLLPLSIKQQKTMKKTSKIQEKMKIIQFKYKNDPEKMNQEVMNLYKEEKMSPFSGCLTAIIQLILLLSVFYLVRNPITYMQKLPKDDINEYINQLQENGKITNKIYSEIDLIREYEWLKESNPDKQNIDDLNVQMNFLGLDLNKVPQQNLNDYTVYIIPVLYIISSFISIRLSTKQQEQLKNNNNEDVIVSNEEIKEVKEDNDNNKQLVKIEDEKDPNEVDTVMQTNKMMSWMMPLMSISIAFVAPLGLALYWFVNNVLMILERLVLNKTIGLKEE